MRFCLREQLSTLALATGQFIQSFCLRYAYVAYSISYNSIYKVLPWDG